MVMLTDKNKKKGLLQKIGLTAADVYSDPQVGLRQIGTNGGGIAATSADSLATGANLKIRKGLGFNTEEEGLDTALTPKKKKKNLNGQFIDPLGTVLGG